MRKGVFYSKTFKNLINFSFDYFFVFNLLIHFSGFSSFLKMHYFFNLFFFLFVFIFDFVLRQPFFYRCYLTFFINFLSCFTIFPVLFIFFFFPPFISNWLFLLSFLLVHKLIRYNFINLKNISSTAIWSHFIWDYAVSFVISRKRSVNVTYFNKCESSVLTQS